MSCFFKSALSRFVISNQRYNQCPREYARWTHRRPKRVLTQEKFEESERKDENLSPEEGLGKIDWKHPVVDNTAVKTLRQLDSLSDSVVQYKIVSTKLRKPKQMPAVDKTRDMLQTVIDGEGNFVYTKLGNHDPKVGTLLTTLKSIKLRDSNDLVLLEGKRLIRDALESKCQLHSVIFSRKDLVEYLKPFLPKTGANIYKIPYREIQMWSDLTTSPGIMGIFKKPKTETFVTTESIPLTVICDNIREPGNLGGILRTLAGVAVQEVILTKGCTDLWDFKVLRGACGAHFNLKIHTQAKWDDIRVHMNRNGVSNVFIADNNIVSADVERDSVDDELEALESTVLGLPLLPYYGVDYNTINHLVLVIGGETEGISKEAYRLAVDFNGARLNVPLCNRVESLNVGAALGILAFEIKRQLTIARLSDLDETK